MDNEIKQLSCEIADVFNNDELYKLFVSINESFPDLIMSEDLYEKELINRGCDKNTAKQVGLIICVPEFKQYMRKKEHSRVDFQLLIIQEVQSTGLNKYIIYMILQNIFKCMNFVKEYDYINNHSIDIIKEDDDMIYSFPYSVYIDDIDYINKYKNSKDINYMDVLRYYSDIGIPKAKFLFAKEMITCNDKYKGIKLMKEAALAGDASASLFLGNYYYNQGYNKWGDAYKYYSDFGSVIISEKDKHNYLNVINYKEYNKIILGLGGLLVLIGTLLLILIPSLMHTAITTVFSTGSIIIQVILLIIGILRYRSNKFCDSYKCILGIFIIWVLGFLCIL